jgi:REP element-mobilizing transposase RayT
MSRAARLHHPGSAFHIVSRTQGHEPWFVDDIKDEIAEILLRGVHEAGARGVAFAIMDNHLHIILYQGREPLGRVMQPALRRIALLVQRTHQHVGHVFERRFRARLCHDAEHLPNAIVYVHRNPVKAGRCRQTTDYRWSSARAFNGDCAPGFLCIEDGLRAFDTSGMTSIDALREAYRNRLRRCTDKELDGYWDWFVSSVRRRRGTPYLPLTQHRERARLRDLRDVALTILATIDDQCPVELVRSRYGGPRVVAVRKHLVAALNQRGYSGVAIARYMRISEATVSKVCSAMRRAQIPDMQMERE